MPKMLNHLRSAGGDHRVVVDEQHAERPHRSGRDRLDRPPNLAVGLVSYRGQPEFDLGSLAHVARYAHATARLRGEAMNRGETKPRPLSHSLGGKEGLGRALQGRLVHAYTRIGHDDLDIVAGLEAARIARDAVAPRAEVQAAAIGHGVARVE